MNLEILFQLFLATLLGAFIGLEREYKRKEAGLRTYSLVCLGSTFFIIISYQSLKLFQSQGVIYFDPSRIIGQIILGIGFLGAGLIIFRDAHIEGLTTAAGLWVTAAIGAAIGIKFYFLAIFVSFLTVIILAGFRLIEKKLFDKNSQKPTKPGI